MEKKQQYQLFFTSVDQKSCHLGIEEATVTNKVEKTKVKLAEVKSEKKEFVDIGASKPKKLKELDEEELWDL